MCRRRTAPRKARRMGETLEAVTPLKRGIFTSQDVVTYNIAQTKRRKISGSSLICDGIAANDEMIPGSSIAGYQQALALYFHS